MVAALRAYSSTELVPRYHPDSDMIGIDTAILDVTEWLCRKFQWLTGRTNTWLAVQLTNLSVIVYFIWAAVYFQRVPLPTFARVAVALFCGGVLYMLTQTVFRVSIEASETNAYARAAKGLRNPRRVRDAPLRISFLTLSLFLWLLFLFVYLNLRLRDALLGYLPVALLGYQLVVLTTVVLYVLACDPLPPCTGKVTEWIRRMVPARLATEENVR
jgi:hypothetical protein